MASRLDSPRVLVVRPYLANMRGRVYALLSEVGLAMDGAEQIPKGTPDAQAVARIVETMPDVLLVPFHAHRDADGERLDGMALCRRLHEHPRARQVPILMPVTTMAAASLQLMRTTGEHASLHQSLLDGPVMAIADHEVDDPQTPERVLAHLRRFGVHPRGPFG